MMLFEFRVVQLASGLTLSIAGVFKEVLTIVSSVLMRCGPTTLHGDVSGEVRACAAVPTSSSRANQAHTPAVHACARAGATAAM